MTQSKNKGSEARGREGEQQGSTDLLMSRSDPAILMLPAEDKEYLSLLYTRAISARGVVRCPSWDQGPFVPCGVQTH